MSAVIYPTTNLKATEEMLFDHGEGVYIYDQQGKQYLEGLAGLWCTGLGYGNRELIDCISEQLSKLSFTHMFGGKTHQPGIDLADKLAAMVPVQDARVFFGNSGSTSGSPPKNFGLTGSPFWPTSCWDAGPVNNTSPKFFSPMAKVVSFFLPTSTTCSRAKKAAMP